MTRKKTTIDYVKSSGNVFADLGLPHPERALLKAGLILPVQEDLRAQAGRAREMTGTEPGRQWQRGWTMQFPTYVGSSVCG